MGAIAMAKIKDYYYMTINAFILKEINMLMADIYAMMKISGIKKIAKLIIVILDIIMIDMKINV